MSACTTMTNLVEVNWRRYDQMPIMIRRAWPAYCLRIDITAMRYEHASGGRKKTTISGKTLRRIGTKTSLSAIDRTEGQNGRTACSARVRQHGELLVVAVTATENKNIHQKKHTT